MSRQCVDHGWECTGLGHEKVYDLKNLFKFDKENPVALKIPFEPTCTVFLAALAEIQAPNDLSLLDVRLGLEQLLDDPDFRAELTSRWADGDPTQVELGPEESFDRFRETSPRHAALSTLQVKEALGSIIDQPEFKEAAEDRWARFDANPWPLVVQDLAGVDDAA